VLSVIGGFTMSGVTGATLSVVGGLTGSGTTGVTLSIIGGSTFSILTSAHESFKIQQWMRKKIKILYFIFIILGVLIVVFIFL
jgi:hypothetical protein